MLNKTFLILEKKNLKHEIWCGEIRLVFEIENNIISLFQEKKKSAFCGLSAMSLQKKRYRQASVLRGQSSDKQFKIVSDARPFTHECPNCLRKFPAKSASFGKCMSVHADEEATTHGKWEFANEG